MAMTLVSTTTVGSGGAASIEFTNIPQTGKDLLILVSGRDVSTGANFYDIQVKINGATTSLSTLRLSGNGSAVSSGTAINRIRDGLNGSLATASTFSNVSWYISNYAGSSGKSWSADAVTENNATSAAQSINAGLYNSSTAITSLSIEGSGNLAEFSSASLYIIS